MSTTGIELPDTADYDAAVAAMDGIDPWCSSSDWVVPLSASLHAEAPFVIRTATGWGLFDRFPIEGGTIVVGIDATWGFACPVVGDAAAWRDVAARISDTPWDRLIIPGIVEGSETWHRAVAAFAPVGDLFRGDGIARQRADLSGGADAWMRRRSPGFRQALRRIRRDATSAGVTIEDAAATTAAALMARLVAIERTSWKGATDDGIADERFARFYALMLERLAPRGAVRALVARRDGRDVGFILGGVRGDHYRGFQLSFAEEQRSLSIGHLLQLEQIERLAGEDIALYDLGMDIAYKRRWADHALETAVLAVVRR